MSDYFDQIDNYLIDRLSEAERVVFESQMNSDPALKSEVEMKQLLVKKIQNARVRELKTMLNGIPIAVGIGFLTNFLAPMKVILAVATITASISTWYYINNKAISEPKTPAPNQVEKPINQEQKDSVAASVIERKSPNKKDTVDIDTPQKLQKPQTEKTTVIFDTLKKPQGAQTEKVPVVADTPTISIPDVSAENTSTKEVENDPAKKDPATAKKGRSFLLEIMLHPAVNNHPLSYKFENNTLMLYGDPGKNPYKVLDFIHTKNELYLYFADNYYALDTRQRELKKVDPLTNTKLIEQLKESRDK